MYVSPFSVFTFLTGMCVLEQIAALYEVCIYIMRDFLEQRFFWTGKGFRHMPEA